MTIDNSSVILSQIDEEHFGIKTAKALALKVHDIAEVLRFCHDNKVELLIARCLTKELNLVQVMEGLGFLLMDTLIYYLCNLKKNLPPEYTPEVNIRPLRAGEEKIIKLISAETFKGYLGHYHADQRLDKAKCDEVYMDWAYRSCLSTKIADEVLVAEYDGKIGGFGTMRINSLDEGEGLLFAVAPSFQGKGIYRLLITGGMKWCIEQGCEKMVVSTQVTNVAVQKVWSRLGFEPNDSYYTLHKWFDTMDV